MFEKQGGYTAHSTFLGGDTAHKNIFKCSDWGGDTAHENISKCSYWVWTPHNFSRKKLMWSGGGWVGGRVEENKNCLVS